MSTRSIVTSQPDVACDVCSRRLLRGEQPDVFLVAGERRTVCELCAPRAAHEGWLRETDGQTPTLAPMRPRRGRNLFDRLSSRRRQPPRAAREQAADEALDPFDRLSGGGELGAQGGQDGSTPTSPAADASPPVPAAPWQEPVAGEPMVELTVPRQQAPPYLEDALAVFNSSEFPRRMAGVARSLGAPAVSVRSAEHLDSVVSIVVAWELCWYRYEVDLSEPGAEAQSIAQGTELMELAREDLLANAAAAESGTLELVLA